MKKPAKKMNEKHETLIQISPSENNRFTSFTIQKEPISKSHIKLHHHSEIEIVKISNGKGDIQIGTENFPFKVGNVFILGSHLPHCWKPNDIVKHQEMDIIQFCPDFWGSDFINLPENEAIRTFLKITNYGVKLPFVNESEFARLFKRALKATDSAKIIVLLEILNFLSKTNDLLLMTNENKSFVQDELYSRHKIEMVLQYIQNNFKKSISLRDVATLVQMNQNYFCRYFKSQTGKTFVQYLTEIRIRFACKLISEKKLNLKQICYQSGFNNMTSFHKAFKTLTQKSPLEFQKAILIQINKSL